MAAMGVAAMRVAPTVLKAALLFRTETNATTETT
jgi:hypothetical protein